MVDLSESRQLLRHMAVDTTPWEVTTKGTKKRRRRDDEGFVWSQELSSREFWAHVESFSSAAARG